MSEGDKLLQEAQRKQQYKGWFGQNKLFDAADLFQRAANAYKLSKQCISRNKGSSLAMLSCLNLFA
jgi:hypothetical protein